MVDVAMGRRRNSTIMACAVIAACAGVALAAAPTPSAAPTARLAAAISTVTPTSTPSPTVTPTSTPSPVPSDPVKPAAPAVAPQPAAGNTPALAASMPGSAAPTSPINPGRTPGVIALLQTNDGSERDPGNWIVRIYKSRHRLEVYYKGRFYRGYRAVFGRNLDTSAKLFAGDRRTPEGSYLIVSKYPSRRWRYFLRLNYPNVTDLSRFEELRAAHEIAALDAGGSIGIHGTDVPMLNEGNINWTTGCISVDNGAIDELEALLPVGTTVVIKP